MKKGIDINKLIAMPCSRLQCSDDYTRQDRMLALRPEQYDQIFKETQLALEEAGAIELFDVVCSNSKEEILSALSQIESSNPDLSAFTKNIQSIIRAFNRFMIVIDYFGHAEIVNDVIRKDSSGNSKTIEFGGKDNSVNQIYKLGNAINIHNICKITRKDINGVSDLISLLEEGLIDSESIAQQIAYIAENQHNEGLHKMIQGNFDGAYKHVLRENALMSHIQNKDIHDKQLIRLITLISLIESGIKKSTPEDIQIVTQYFAEAASIIGIDLKFSHQRDENSKASVVESSDKQKSVDANLENQKEIVQELKKIIGFVNGHGETLNFLDYTRLVGLQNLALDYILFLSNHGRNDNMSQGDIKEIISDHCTTVQFYTNEIFNRYKEEDEKKYAMSLKDGDFSKHESEDEKKDQNDEPEDFAKYFSLTNQIGALKITCEKFLETIGESDSDWGWKIRKVFLDCNARIFDLKEDTLSEHSITTAYFYSRLVYQDAIDNGMSHCEAKILARKAYEEGAHHDSGKILSPKEILTHSGKLNDEQFKIIKAHPKLGSIVNSSLGANKESILQALRHHEKPNGKGYPFNLDGKQLSNKNIMLTVADMYSALLQVRRAYQDQLSVSHALGKSFFEFWGNIEREKDDTGRLEKYAALVMDISGLGEFVPEDNSHFKQIFDTYKMIPWGHASDVKKQQCWKDFGDEVLRYADANPENKMLQNHIKMVHQMRKHEGVRDLNMSHLN